MDDATVHVRYKTISVRYGVDVRASFALSANNFGWSVVFTFISIIIYKTSLAGNKMVKWTSGKSDANGESEGGGK